MDSLWFFTLVVALTGQLSYQYSVNKTDNIKPRLLIDPDQDAPLGGFPHQVLLYAKTQYCSGAILNDKWIITAYHCVEGVSSPSQIHILVGELNTEFNENREQAMFGNRILLPPGNPMPDIALIRLSKDIAFDWKYIAPIEIGKPNDGFNYHDINLKGNLSGWGNGNNDGLTRMLQYSEMTRLNDPDCTLATSATIPRTNNTFCVVNIKTEICDADGGDPYVVKKPNEDRQYLIGIASRFKRCTTGAPALLTDVIAHYEWITKTISGAQSVAAIASTTIVISLISSLYTSS